MNNISDENISGIVAEGRKYIKVFSILSVDSFDEFQISVSLKDGDYLVIDGSSLSVKDVNLDKGMLEAEGVINGLNYYEKNPEKKSSGIKGIFGLK